MNPFSSIHLAVKQLGRNKVRTFLTMLGIVIGIASVIAMVAMGQGASSMVEKQISSMGRNLMMIFPGAASSGGFSFGAGSTTTLTPDDGAAIAKEVPSVAAVTPIVRTRGQQLIYNNQNWVPGSLMGCSTSYTDVRDWEIETGAFFTEQDVFSASKVCVLGKTVADNLFQGEDPVDKIIRVKNMPFKVVGVLSKKGTNAMGSDQDDLLLAPWTTVKRVLQGSAFHNVDQLLVTAHTAAGMTDAQADITTLLRQRHRLRDKEDSDFRILPMSEIASTMTQTSRVMTVLLAFIASISLLVGGIGIMNIMLVSVVERTREIGLRMAVGARRQDILLQFLMESVVLSSFAGAIGMALGAGSAIVISQVLRWPTLISPGSIGISFVFSCAVGVFFGFYPAMRASRLDPIEALRYE
ncbi:MAG: ABC transporter permease [Planctomycetaceae bacterium]|nr:ABC transporter permease [Planctomycetaceae bacterium]